MSGQIEKAVVANRLDYKPARIDLWVVDKRHQLTTMAAIDKCAREPNSMYFRSAGGERIEHKGNP